jgi:hypothetical protein
VSFVEAVIDNTADTAATAVVQQQYSPSSTLSSSSGGYNSSSTTLNPASSNSSGSSSNNYNTTPSTSPPWPSASDPEQWSALQILEPDLERWREVVGNSPHMQQQQISGLGNVGFSDADTGSWMNFFDSSSNQYQQNGQVAAGTGNSGAFLSDLYEGGGYEQQQQQPAAVANALPSPPSGKKVMIIDVAKFVKGKSSSSNKVTGRKRIHMLTFSSLCNKQS